MKEGWKYRKLEEICSKGSSNISLNKIEDNNGEYNLYGASGLVKGIDFYHQEQQYIGIVKDGSGVGRVNIYPPKSSLVGTMQYIFPNEGCEIGFLKYLLQGLHLEKYKTGAAIPHIYFKDYCKSIVPFPPLSEQQHIVEELDLLSSIIEKKKAQLKELDNLAQSLFYEMFGDPIINNMEWEVKTLKELVYIGLGFTHTPQYVEKGVPFISVKDISSGYIDLSKIKYVSKEEYDNAPKGAKPQKGDLMFCRVGTMGKPLIVETDMQFCTFVSVGYMRRLQNNIDMSFLKYWMLSNSFDKQVEANVRGLAIKNLNTGWLKNFSIYLPPLSIQQQFAEKVEAIEHQKELIKQSIKEVETLFNSRMDYYFN